MNRRDKEGKQKKGEEEESGRFERSQTVKCEVKEKQ